MKKGIDYVGVYVTGFCHDSEGKILWRRRSDGAFDESGTWQPGAGGSLEPGETLEQALYREIKEETMADVISHEFLGHLEVFRELSGETTHWLGFYYKCLVDQKQVSLPNNEEADELLWESYHNAPQPTMTHFPDEYEKFKKYL